MVNWPAAVCHTILGKLKTTLWAVPLLVPVSAVTLRQERPCARRAAILGASTTTRGLPSALPRREFSFSAQATRWRRFGGAALLLGSCNPLLLAMLTVSTANKTR